MASEKREKLEAQIKSADMSEDMQQEAIDVATEAMDKYHIEKDIAQYIKKEFDLRKGATWHCIVGRNFGSFVTHAQLFYFTPELGLRTIHINSLIYTQTPAEEEAAAALDLARRVPSQEVPHAALAVVVARLRPLAIGHRVVC
ncbi:Dynein light chain [Onygenales sp. PD_12]|nr:Dynein light chain [Onygenales sp. PD_12]